MATSVVDLCQKQQITLAQLVEQSGLEQERITAILQGRWTPSPAERQAIATVFHVSISEVAWGHKSPVEHLYGHGPGGETSRSLRGI